MYEGWLSDTDERSAPGLVPWSWTERRIESNSARVTAGVWRGWDLVADYRKEACRAANGSKWRGMRNPEYYPPPLFHGFAFKGALGGYGGPRGLGECQTPRVQTFSGRDGRRGR